MHILSVTVIVCATVRVSVTVTVRVSVRYVGEVLHVCLGPDRKYSHHPQPVLFTTTQLSSQLTDPLLSSKTTFKSD